jgi:stage V sporulation protein SpoVS
MEADTKGLAAILNVARQFVKDNGIEAVIVPGSPAGKLADKLKEFPFDASSDRSH